MYLRLHYRSVPILAASLAVAGLALQASPANSALASARPATPAPPAGTFARPALPVGQRYTCRAPTKAGQMTCLSIVQSSQTAKFEGYGPADLQKAYHLTAAASRPEHGKTVAIVDAFSDPRAIPDLARYRKVFDLPACTVQNGCLRIVNQKGASKPLPAPDPGWATEESLDLDMVSAVCPKCHILLVEANTNSESDLAAAVTRAVAMGAKYVSNSWGGPELLSDPSQDHSFNHPGVVMDFAAGDNGYGPGYPAASPYVTAVGGTSLTKSANARGFTESVWGSATVNEGTNSGCSGLEPKPSWQRSDDTEPTGCLNRTENDVSAVADPKTGVFVFDSYQQPGRLIVGGTSASTPIITGIYALAGAPTPNTYPAEYPYLHPKTLFDVTTGTNGQCEPDRQYLCNAEPGYDAPTGLGTPDGLASFTDHGAHRVTVIDPGTTDARAGATFSLRITALDSAKAANPPLSFSATGLPSGLAIQPIAHSTNAMITGTLPSTPGTFPVTVTARDGKTADTTHFAIVTLPSLTTAAASPGELSQAGADGLCLAAGSGGKGATAKVESCDAGSPSSSQQWLFTSDGRPGYSGQLTSGGLCLSLPAKTGQADLATCDGSVSQQWRWQFDYELHNLSTGTCLTGQGLGSTVHGQACLNGAGQTWKLPASQITSDAASASQLCLDNPGNAATGITPATVTDCSNSPEQQWTSYLEINAVANRCLIARGHLSGSPVVLARCPKRPEGGEEWLPFGNGELINVVDGLCLADPGDGGPGTALVQESCYGKPDEIWGVN